MRRVILALASTVAGLVLLLTFKTHGTSAVATPPAAISSPNPSVSGPASDPAATPSASSASSSPSSSPSTEPSHGTAAAKTYTGAAADTVYGPVQVRITVKNGAVTAAQAVEYPENSPRDQQINAYAIPELNQEAVSAGSARIDMISGATYTSNGYITSLQSALDQAGL